jgi:hypothetical protein
MLKRQQEHIIFAKNSKTKENRREVKEKSSISSIQILVKLRLQCRICTAAVPSTHPKLQQFSSADSHSQSHADYDKKTTCWRLCLCNIKSVVDSMCVCESVFRSRK